MFCAKFVSWNSSTSTCGCRAATRWRTCGFSCSSRKACRIRSPKSSAPDSPRKRSWSAYTCANSCSRSAWVRSASLRALGRQRRGVAAEVGGRHGLVLQPVDPRDERPEQGRRVAADLVPAEHELVEAVEQQREPVGRRDGGEERVEARLERLLLEQPRGERVERVHRELLVGRVDQHLQALAHLSGRRLRKGEREHLVGARTLLYEPRKPACERPGSCPCPLRRR